MIIVTLGITIDGSMDFGLYLGDETNIAAEMLGQ